MSIIEEFTSYIKSQGKHGFYQLLPPALINKYNELQELPYKSIRLDDKRYEFFTKHLNTSKARVTDIGANIGYFSFRLATEKKCSVVMYEPFEDHYKAINSIGSMLEAQDNIKAVNDGVTLSNIDSLEKTDILLLFNVLQHAGEDFDKDIVKSKNDWYQYAVEYLTKLRSKSKYLVFQNGYSWLGHDVELCARENILPFSKQLLEDAGWTVKHCGMVKNYSTKEYIDIPLNAVSGPTTNKLKYLEYGIKYRLGLALPNYQFIQRPIYICES